MNAGDELRSAEAQASRLPAYTWIVVAALAVIVFAYCKGKSDGASSVKVAEAKQAVKVADVARAAAVETVYVAAKVTATAQAAKNRIDAKLPVLAALPEPARTPSGPVTKADTIFIPQIVMQRIEADSILIDALAREIGARKAQSVADAQAIAARDNLIRQLKPGWCGVKCGVTLGVLGTFGVLKATHAKL